MGGRTKISPRQEPAQGFSCPEFRRDRIIPPGERRHHHTMGGTESLWDVASRYQVGVADLLAANELTRADASSLHPGRRLRIPGVAPLGPGTAQRLATQATRRAEGLAERLGLNEASVAGRLFHGRADANWVQAAGPAALHDDSLLWPVRRGHYVRGFGSGRGGYHLATDIAADVGQKVRAAAGGVVAYAGRGISGYGNVVFVVHPSGWITMYAHNSANEVVTGERVARGDVIAEVGSTGISRGPHLHFEFMFQGENCDPTHLFPPWGSA